MRKTDAQTRVHAHTLTSEIYFSIQVLDLRGQAELEQVQTVTAGRDTISKRHMREEVTQEQEKKTSEDVILSVGNHWSTSFTVFLTCYRPNNQSIKGKPGSWIATSDVTHWLRCIVGNVGVRCWKGRRMCGTEKVISLFLLCWFWSFDFNPTTVSPTVLQDCFQNLATTLPIMQLSLLDAVYPHHLSSHMQQHLLS